MDAVEEVMPKGGTLRGVLPPRPRLAVVGSRAAHRRFREAVPVVVEVLHAQGWSLVSGGALGIDGDAHRAALAGGVPQLAVLPCGADRAYPPGHAELFEAIAAAPDSGLLYAQPPGTETTRAMFISRNRYVVALADAVLVVEAGRRSGTLHTGRLAIRQGRPTAALVGSPGAAELVAVGASALTFDAARSTLPASLRAWLSGRPVPIAWPVELASLRDALAEAPPQGLTLDVLTARDPAARTMLLQAQLCDLVVEVAPGRWRAV